MNRRQWASDNLIHKIYAGSRLYGTERPDSDYDERGVCTMPKEALLGLSPFEQYNAHNENEDVVIYGLTKFFRLAIPNNPNILELLFAPSDTWLLDTSAWAMIYERRHLFLSERVRYTFSGYAFNQLERLQRHYAWLTNPPDHKPEVEEFGGSLEALAKGGQKNVFPHSDAENKYRAAAKRWKQYQEWLTNRNPTRAKLEAQYGYDTKHAANLVRMMIQGKALLSTGTFNPRLEPEVRDAVLCVLNGGWTYEYLLDWATEEDASLKNMPTVLPKKAPFREIEGLLMALNHDSI